MSEVTSHALHSYSRQPIHLSRVHHFVTIGAFNSDAMQFRMVKFVLMFAIVAGALGCKKMPSKSLNYGKKQSGDNGYRLVIGNNPDEGYEPGKIYNCMC